MADQSDMDVVYNMMWEQYHHAIEGQEIEFDSTISMLNDDRMGVAFVGYLNDNSRQVTENIAHFTNELKNIDSTQYIHPINDIHLTILTLVTCISGFKIQNIDQDEMIRLCRDSLEDIEELEINFKGVTATPTSILIKGYPVGTALEQLRSNLRKNFEQSALETTIDQRYKLVTAHSSVARFHTPTLMLDDIYDLCLKYRDYDFGTVTFKNLKLIVNDIFVREQYSYPLQTFSV